MAEKGVDHLGCIHNRADVQTQNAEKEQNLCIHKTSGTPEISKALAESNLRVSERQSESANFSQQTMGDKAPQKHRPLTSLVKLEFPGTLEIADEMCKQQSADKIHTKRMTRVVGIKPEC